MCWELDRKERWIHPCNQNHLELQSGALKQKATNASEFFVSSQNKPRFTLISCKDHLWKGRIDKLVFIYLSSASGLNNLAEEVIPEGKAIVSC